MQGGEVSERVLVEVERVDAHPGDLHRRRSSVEVSVDLMISDLLSSVLAPFLEQAPRAAWLCRGRSKGSWQSSPRW